MFRELQLRSDYCRWALPGVRTLTDTKRLLETATGAGPSGGCRKYCGHRAFATLLAHRY